MRPRRPPGTVGPGRVADPLEHHARGHRMASFHLGGWRVTGMAQAIPVWARGHGAAGPDGADGVDGGGLFLTRPPAMVGVESPGRRPEHARRGGDPDALYGAGWAWGLSVGVRVSLGGGPMRMGTYGVLDPMTAGAHAAPTPPRNAPSPGPRPR